jgi:hypothetical protein
MRLRSLLVLPALFALAALLTGCGLGSSPHATSAGPVSSIQLSGKVHGGQQPVAGATIQLYTVGTSSDGSASTPLLIQTVTSDSGGNFTLTNLYSCNNATLVYLTATGGTPGGSTPNPNLALMTALGPCSSLTSSTFIFVNELTTVAAVSALTPYMSSVTSVGSSPSDLSGLTAAFTLANQYVNSSTGISPGSGAPAGTTLPTALINTLGNVVAACINSVGGTAGDSSTCGQLFEFTTPGNSPPPTNTIAALLYLANNPTLNTPLLYALASPSAPFQPGLPSAPQDFRIIPTPVNTSSLTITPSVLTFPTGTVGTASTPQLVTIQNLTGAAVTISGITLTGADAADFSQTNNCPGTLGANASCNALVTITPSVAGARIGYLAVADSTPASPQYVTLTLNNVAPTLASVNPNSLSTGSTSPTDVLLIGSNFLPTSMVQVGGTNRPTTYFSSTELIAQLSVADQAKAGTLSFSVVNPPPGGGASTALNLTLIGPASTPVISQVSPATFTAGSGITVISATGSNFTALTALQWNGTNLATALYSSPYSGYYLVASVPANLLTSPGTASITAYSATASPTTSNALTVTISNPPAPTLTGISPNGGPINTATAVTLTGTGFTASSSVALNGQTIPSTYVSTTQLTATFPASSLPPGNVNVTVTTPAPGGGTSSAQVYTTYLSIPNNDLVYNPADGMLYASVPGGAVGGPGNSVFAIDPLTAIITRQIQVGSNPNKLALSSDGTQLFVGLDGAGAVAQVNLAQGKVVNQFALGGGPGIYNAPYTAQYLAAVPGSPNSVAVAVSGGISTGAGVTIYDSGVARTNSSTNVGDGPLSFGLSASTLYMAGSYIEALNVGSTGISGATQLYSSSGSVSQLQYDNGQLYLSTGAVLNASTGVLAGTFYSSASTTANGPVVSDSSLGRAFIATTSFSNNGVVYAFDESTFNLIGNIPVNGVGTQGYPTSFRKIVRWGQNGIALATIPSAFSSSNQIYIFQSPLVKDLSPTPADLSVSLTAPATTSTGTAVNWVATVSDSGPNSALGTALTINLDPSLIINSVTASQGACATGNGITCDLGNLANGASVTVTVSATPTSSGTLAGTANVTSTSYDPNLPNNQSTTSTTVMGGLYGAVPAISAISPNIVQAGSANMTLTVTGTGFNAGSTVYLGTTALATSYISSTQLTATVTTAEIANYGWAAVTVSNPTPGGGVSAVAPLTIYGVVNVPASSILFDPYGQSLYATIPGSATGMTGNSVVSINPFTGAVGTPVLVGSQPTVMAETADGNYLYISLTGSNMLAQYDLLHQTFLQNIFFSGAPAGYGSMPAATALAVMPGTDTTLAVDFSGTVGIMDITGGTGKFRPNFAGDNFPTFADATHLYTYDNESSGAEFYRYSINANGLTLIDGTTLDGMGGFSGGFAGGNGLVYGAGGGIINPTTTPPSQIATLPPIDFYESGISTSGVAAWADPSLQKDFLMLENTAGTWAYGLGRYDLTTYLPEAVLEMPASASGVSSNWTMLRFGQDGLALLSFDNFGVTPAVTELILLRGPFVAPQELGTSTAANLTASSATTITHGSGNTMLTLTGSNFLPGVAVTWNGSYRTTTIVDATHVTVAIPVSDLAQTGTGTVVATNPGASASNALQITIN